MLELKPCPICGKMPKIRYIPVNSGFAKCKPIFGKTHLLAVVAYAAPSQLKEAIVEEWNNEVDKCLR